MEEDDEIHSHQSGSPPLPPAVAENGRIAVDFDGASSPVAAPPDSSSNLPSPIQQPRRSSTAGGGRDDCWSDGSTGVLIAAWGERYLEMRRGNLKEKHWKEVAEIVGGGGGRTRPPRTHVQCKYRIDTVKRKYKLEKAKVAAGHGPSKWAFFENMERIIGPGKAQSLSTARLGTGKARRQPPAPLDEAERPLRPQHRPLRTGADSDSDTESDRSADILAKSPPLLQPPTSRRMDRKSGEDEGKGNGLGVLRRAVQRFVEVYEKAEMVKMRQELEMEKQRMRCVKEAELQSMQLMMAAQVEISKMRRPRPPRHDREKRSGGSGGSGNGSDRN